MQGDRNSDARPSDAANRAKAPAGPMPAQGSNFSGAGIRVRGNSGGLYETLATDLYNSPEGRRALEEGESGRKSIEMSGINTRHDLLAALQRAPSENGPSGTGLGNSASGPAQGGSNSEQYAGVASTGTIPRSVSNAFNFINGSDREVNDFHKMIDQMWNRSPTAQRVLAAVTGKGPVNIQFNNQNITRTYPHERVVDLDMYKRQLTDGGWRSPMVVAGHEFTHLLDDPSVSDVRRNRALNNGQDNEDEARSIGFENQIARELDPNAGWRWSHSVLASAPTWNPAA